MRETSINNNGESWQRGKLLGKGCFGTVHLAHFPSPNPNGRFQNFPPLVAVKSSLDSNLLAQEKKSYDCIGQSPYIIQCFGDDVTVAGDGKYQLNVFLEYASGGTLSDLIKKTRGIGLLESQVREFTRSIVKGLKHIHEAGFVHRDVKAENVLLVEDEEGKFVAKIGDFGLAKNERERLEYIEGTEIYLAPECFSLCTQNTSSDIWALGCIVLSMLTGRLEWYGRPSIGAKMVSEEAEDFVRKCLWRDFKIRPTAADLLDHPFLTGAKVRRGGNVVVSWERSVVFNDGFGDWDKGCGGSVIALGSRVWGGLSEGFAKILLILDGGKRGDKMVENKE